MKLLPTFNHPNIPTGTLSKKIKYPVSMLIPVIFTNKEEINCAIPLRPAPKILPGIKNRFKAHAKRIDEQKITAILFILSGILFKITAAFPTSKLI